MQAPRLRFVLLFAICSFIITVVIVTFFTEISKITALGNSLDKKMTELEKVERKNQELKKKLSNAKTAGGVEREAREKYNLVKPGEKMYQIKIQGKE